MFAVGVCTICVYVSVFLIGACVCARQTCARQMAKRSGSSGFVMLLDSVNSEKRKMESRMPLNLNCLKVVSHVVFLNVCKS